MFGCIWRLGCLLMLAACAAAAWFTRDAWLPSARKRLHLPPAAVTAPAVTAVAAAKWEPLTPEGAVRARDAIATLQSRSGRVYVDVAAGDLAAYAIGPAIRELSHDSTGAEALARDERLYVRAMVNVADLADATALGPLATMLNGRQEVTVRGRLEVVGSGRAEFLVDEIAFKELQLPSALIEKIVSRLQVKSRTAGTPKNAIRFTIPRELADVRIAKGHVVLYKSVP
ncbi:MAG: hypothetical protein ACREN6_07455 [Gemmatimonadaceae bacterium]